MKSKAIAAILAVILITLSGVAFVYSGIMFISNLIGSILIGVVKVASSGAAFENPVKPLDFTGMQFEFTHSHVIPAVIGVLALVVGIVLLVAIRKWVWPPAQHLNQAARP